MTKNVFETYERRRLAAQRAGEPDVFEYDQIPDFLRRQLVIILGDSIGIYSESQYEHRKANSWWEALADIMTREVESFPRYRYDVSPYDRCVEFVRNEQNVDRWLSFVEVACRVLERVEDSSEYQT